MKDYVYLLEHIYQQVEGDYDTTKVKTLGIFASKEETESAIEFYKTLKGFKDYPDCFNIDKYELNEKEWTEGFVTIEADEPEGE